MLALLLSAVCTLAVAETDLNHLPAPLNKSLRGNAIKSAQLDNGVLRLQMDKPAVSELVYSTFVFHNICADGGTTPTSSPNWHWPGGTAQRVSQQGYAFDARGDVCVQMGQLGRSLAPSLRSARCRAKRACPKHP